MWLTISCQAWCGLILSIMAKHDPDLSLLFHALSDQTRREMLRALATGPATVSALAAPTGLRLPTVMRHLAVLEAAGLIATAKDGRVRSCAFQPAALAPAQDWLAVQRSLWDARLDRLEEYVMTLMETQNAAD
jgi:DNA-binding transcriptional ArsR family regulator